MNQTRLLPAPFLFGAIWLGLTAYTSADVLVSNLDERWDDGGGIGEIHGIFSNPYSGPAGVFHTGSGQHYLTSVTLEHAHWYELTVSPQFRLLLFSQSEFGPRQSGIPVIAELQHPVLNSTPTQFPKFSQRVDYSSLAPIILEADTTYWIGAYLPPGTTDAALMFVHSTAELGKSGWSISDYSHSGFTDDTGEIVWGLDGGPGRDILKFAVNGVAVPEAPLWSLLAIGLSLLAWCSRRGSSFYK